MKKNHGTIYYALTLFGLILILFCSCKKEKDSDNELTDADGNVYTSETIGTQIWMIENLKTTKYNDGSPIPLITDNTAWRNATTQAYCWYNNEIGNKDPYGALYNWFAVNTDKLCPKGWHVSSESDWNDLIDFLGGETVAGGKLKTPGTIEGNNGLWYQPNVDATNETKFSALPGGMRGNGFYDFGYGGEWWSSSEYSSARAFYFYINNFDGTVGHTVDGGGKENGFSVRCIKDN